MNKRAFLLSFGVLAGLDLVVLSFGWPVRWITKPLIMLSLIVYYHDQTKGCSRNTSWWIFLLALILALAGDIFLLNDELFQLGLLSFLGMQVCYGTSFVMGRNFFGMREWIAGIIITMVALACILFLWPHAGSFQVPVAIYAVCIGLMAFLAYTRDFRYPGYWLVFSGALLFMISDTLLSVNQFAEGIAVHGTLIMITYALAQYCIVQGWILFTCKD